MAAITGQNAALSWIYSGGTVVLDTDYRNISDSPTGDTYDQSAGADQAHKYIAGATDGQLSWSALYQAGGTVMMNALKFGYEGTLVYGWEGTAAGKPKKTIPALCLGASMTPQYNNLIEIACNFQYNGTTTDGSF